MHAVSSLRKQAWRGSGLQPQGAHGLRALSFMCFIFPWSMTEKETAAREALSPGPWIPGPSFPGFESGTAHTRYGEMQWLRPGSGTLTFMSWLESASPKSNEFPRGKLRRRVNGYWGSKKINKTKTNIYDIVQLYNGTAISWNILSSKMFGRILKTWENIHNTMLSG